MANFRNTMITILIAAVAALFVACADNDHFEGAKNATPDPDPQPVPTIKWASFNYPEDSTKVDFLDENLNPLEKGYKLPQGSAVVLVEETKYADAKEAWDWATSRHTKNLTSQEDTAQFLYNYGINTVAAKVVIRYQNTNGTVLEVPLYEASERLQLRGGKCEVTEEGHNGRLYYGNSETRYRLIYTNRDKQAICIASAVQPFVAQEGYVPAFLRTVWNYKHDAFERNASLSNNIITVRCNNIANFCGEWDDNTYRDSLEVSYPVANKFAFSATEIKVNDLTTVIGKTFNFTNGVVTIAGSEVKAIWQSAAVVGNVMYKGVNYKDSITACVCAARTVTFNTASQATIKFYDHNANDYAETTVAVKVTENEKPVTLVRIDSTFVHNAFVSNATVSGNNIAVICNNTASFVKVWSNGKKDQKQDVKYVVTNNFSYSMPSYISLEAKGKTYSFNGSTATVVGKNVTVTFTSRVIADIMFNNKNYKNDPAVPKCEVAIKTVKFGETTATFTFSHGSETVTAEVPVTYNGMKGYEMVGNPIHDSWNTAYGTEHGFGITCNNHVVVREVMTDGSKGNSFDLPYKSTNTWTVSGKTSFQVDNLSSILNVRYDIVNGSSATVDGNTINFSHAMSAEKVSKGTFSYQPSACEAVARYITVTSSTTARVDIYHENTKVGDYIIPVNITEKEKPHDPDFDGKIVWGGATDSYVDGANVATWEGCYMHFIVENNGTYKVYSRKVGETGAWRESSVSAAYVSSITNSRPVAFIGNTAAAYSLGSCKWADQGSWSKIVYYDYNGGVARVISEISKTIGGESSNNCRVPLRGSWKNGTITVDGKTYKVTGSQN